MHRCQKSFLVSPHEGNNEKVYYYNDLQSSKVRSVCIESFYCYRLYSQSSSWAATVMLIVLSIWSLLLVIVYCRRQKRRRRERQLAKLQEGDYQPTPDDDETSPSSSSDAENVNKKGPNNPFART